MAIVLLASRVSFAEDIDYAKDIQPIFQANCLSCHGEQDFESGLRLDKRAWMLRGGDHGEPTIVPGQPEKSFLFQVLRSDDPDLQMPPGGPPLEDKEVELLKRWVTEGAPWPGQMEDRVDNMQSDHWSLQPVQQVVPPEVAGEWPANAIDQFILRKLRENGLEPSPAADRRTLIRRIYWDMLGLPPTPEEVEAFVSAQDPQAFQKLVEEVLSSPRYGERWAQHWLDIVRYADTDGFEVNTPRANAWPYRDYVIDAFHGDKPYNEFVYEQLAGDRVGKDVATGFLVAAPDLLPGQIGQDKDSMLAARQDELDEFVQGATATFMGLTVNCARCHNHKFDPILQSDYFSMQAVFAGVGHGEREISSAMNERLQQRLASIDAEIVHAESELAKFAVRQPVRPDVNEERFEPIEARFVRFVVVDTNNLEPCLDELEIFASNDDNYEMNLALAASNAKRSASGEYADQDRHKLEYVNDGEYGNFRSWISDTAGSGWVQIELAETTEIAAVRWGRDRNRQFTDRLAVHYQVQAALEPGEWTTVASSASRQPYGTEVDPAVANTEPVQSQEEVAQSERLLNRLNELKAQRRALAPDVTRRVYAAVFRQPGPTRRLLRGDHKQPKELVAPDVPRVFGSLQLPPDATESQRRHLLAQWLTSGENPLTARVMVNRIWHYHFGVGIVDTPSDFGEMGSRPTHPELLDWLATELVRSGWSVKQIQRLILLSNTYRQSSLANREEAMAVDAHARLLWRFPSRRLEAEAIRDGMLKIAGTLNLQMGGPGFNLFKPRIGLDLYVPKDSYGPAEWRRMVYAHKVRMEKDGVFTAFDVPDCGQPAPKRSRSTTAIQALNLFNSRFVATQAGHFAERVEQTAGSDPQRQIEIAFEQALTRAPTAEESAACHALLREHSLHDLCRVLLNTNEFVTLP